ncbi:MAG: prolipoprotein diacylglyceryl transferase [Lachnospiraceae bacterium]|nr:prolipoprotein diacylglyceryl transferase [Lachnospiraceae bacterium]
MYDIRFPHLGLTFHNVKTGFTIFGFEVKYYGLIIGLGFLLAYLWVAHEAKRTKQNPELYLDAFLWLVIPAIVGARIYYVLFNAKEYFAKGQGFWTTFKGIINIRNGGLAIYGGLIAGITVVILFARKRKVNIFLMLDTASMGILIGQILGRWGNFFNREAFGEYTDSLFAMQIPTDFFVRHGSLRSMIENGIITDKMAQNVVTYDTMQWISVHPTFLYESLWNLVLFVFLFVYRKHKKFDGELILLYIWGYGLGRVWIEALRSDSLMFFGTGLKVSQLLAMLCVVVASVIIVKKRLDYMRENNQN